MEAQSKTNQKFETVFAQVVEENKEIKSQITKLTSALTVQERGKFPSQPQSNPKGQFMAQASTSDEQNLKEVNAITTRSGKIVSGPTTPTDMVTSSKDAPQEKEAAIEKEPKSKFSAPVPFPQAF